MRCYMWLYDMSSYGGGNGELVVFLKYSFLAIEYSVLNLLVYIILDYLIVVVIGVIRCIRCYTIL